MLASNYGNSLGDAAQSQGENRMASDAFEIYLDDDRYAVPTLHLVVADEPAMAFTIAERLLADSPHHLGAEICVAGERVAGLGTFATRYLPPGGPSRTPDAD